MNTREIYAKYMTPQNLQKHMLRAASLAQILTEHWKGSKLDKKALIECCLFHDIAKPMTFDLAKQAQYGMRDEDIANLVELQNHIKDNYGEEEYHAVIMICKEVGLSEAAISLVDHLEWGNIPRFISANDIISLIPIYCDMRISPKGILSLEARIKDLYNRVGGENYERDMRNGKFLEAKIIEHVSLDVNAITTDQLDANIDALLNMEIA